MGLVIVSTKDFGDSVEISVSDNGPGFVSSKDPGNDRSHIGLLNVKERLRYVCEGELSIDSELGVGTVVKMKIPKKYGGG